MRRPGHEKEDLMPDEPVGGGEVASEGGSEFTGDLGLPTPEETTEIPTEEPTETEPEVIEETPAGGEEVPVEPEPTPEKYTFYGRDWDGQDQAEQFVRSMDGRVRAQGQELSDLKHLIRRWEDWHAYTEEQGAKTKAEATKASDEKTEPLLDSVDWKSVEAIAEKHGVVAGLKTALLGVQDHIRDSVLAKMDTELAEIRKPWEQSQEIQRADQHVKGWMLNAANSVDENGNPNFPELYEEHPDFSEEYAQRIVQSWANITRKYPQFGMSREGIELAIMKSGGPKPAAKAKASPAQAGAAKVGRNAAGQFVKQSAAAQENEAEGGTGATPGDAARQPAQTMTEAEERRRIREAGRVDEKAAFFGMA
jgi:hypothetical protein